MRTNELMLYDNVQLNYRSDHPIMQIISIYGESVLVRNENNCKQWKIGIQDIEPIPLTAEILEKNGWEKYATYGTEEDDCVEVIYMLHQHSFEVVFSDNEAVSIRHFVSWDDDGYNKLLIEMRDNGNKPMCIHTLQHALRLMGLTELANNFRVN